MSDSEERSPRVQFLYALGVPRNARLGVVLGVAFAALVYGVFVVLPAGTNQSPTLLIVLAFVIAVSTAILVVTVLTVRNAASLTMSPPRWVRRGGTAGLVGGAAWIAVSLAGLGDLAGVAVPDAVVPLLAYLLPFPPLAMACGAWAVHATNNARGGYPGLPRELAESLPGIRRNSVSRAFGTGAFAVTTGGLVLVAWMAAVAPGAFLGLPTELDPGLFVGVHLVVLLGTSVLGGAAVRASAAVDAGSAAMLLSLPVALAGLTGLAAASLSGYTPAVLGVVLGLAWIPVGSRFRVGDGVPDEASFREAIAARFEGIDPSQLAEWDPTAVEERPGDQPR